MLARIALLLLVSVPAAAAADHDNRPRPVQVVVVDDSSDHAVVGALVGAGITYWLVRRYQRRHGQPLALTLPPRTPAPARDAQATGSQR